MNPFARRVQNRVCRVWRVCFPPSEIFQSVSLKKIFSGLETLKTLQTLWDRLTIQSEDRR
jgi:hypothetical protein